MSAQFWKLLSMSAQFLMILSKDLTLVADDFEKPRTSFFNSPPWVMVALAFPSLEVLSPKQRSQGLMPVVQPLFGSLISGNAYDWTALCGSEEQNHSYLPSLAKFDTVACWAFCDLEPIYTYEGTYDINTLVTGREVTGLASFKPAVSSMRNRL
ncbi:hypothetical protein MLD38_029760 [Melastoma candidum]|uniref:Uncharacterized protein n=1 Tax=Melastoma candidum TaxID=119954 RepID=A0ACB9N543_9MYRT|nr:hypothetical protein MLD38_029760 [Melastoma candidum]